MAEIKITGDRYTVDPLYQWDTNQTLYIYGVTGVSKPEIHFGNNDMARTLVKQPTVDSKGVITVDVPNSLLQKSYNIEVYICGYESNTFKTYYKLVVPVKGRKRPDDYTLEVSDDEVYSFRAIENKVATLQKAVDDCFQSVSDGKELIASAITDKKVPTDANATYEIMANNISKIVGSSGNATAEDVLEGKTFSNDDEQSVTGTMPNNNAIKRTYLPSGETLTYTIPKGYHNGEGVITITPVLPANDTVLDHLYYFSENDSINGISVVPGNTYYFTTISATGSISSVTGGEICGNMSGGLFGAESILAYFCQLVIVATSDTLVFPEECRGHYIVTGYADPIIIYDSGNSDDGSGDDSGNSEVPGENDINNDRENENGDDEFFEV